MNVSAFDPFEVQDPMPQVTEAPSSGRNELRIRRAQREDLADIHTLIRAVVPEAGVERPLPAWSEQWYGCNSLYWGAYRNGRLLAALHSVSLPVTWPTEAAHVYALGYLAAEEAAALSRLMASVQQWAHDQGSIGLLLWDPLSSSGRSPSGWHRIDQCRQVVSAEEVSAAVAQTLPQDPASARLSPATLNDLPPLRRLYEQSYGHISLAVRRSAVYWSGQLLWERTAPRSARREWLLWMLRMQGEVRGYVRTRRGADLGLRVLEAAADSEEALRALARFLVRNARGSLRLELPEQHPLLSTSPLAEGVQKAPAQPLYAMWLGDNVAPARPLFMAPCDRT